jgi:hypothetical protein
MLKFIDTRSFVECLLLLTILYYVFVLLRYYWNEIKSFWKREKIGQPHEASAREGPILNLSEKPEAPLTPQVLIKPEDKITALGSSPMNSDAT